MQKQQSTISNQQFRAFTLVELLVAVSIFSLSVAVASGLFVSALKAQRKSLASQELQDQTGFVMEYMSRALRMARKEFNSPACLSKNGLNFELTHGKNGIKFVNYQGVCQEFFLDGGVLKESKTGYSSSLPLTSARVSVAAFDIALLGQDQADDVQPVVTFFLRIQGRGSGASRPEIEIQTTVSQRNLDVTL